MIVQLRLRRGTTAEWTTANPLLAAGEPALDTTANVLKIGDGTLRWDDLPIYANDPATIAGLVAAAESAASSAAASAVEAAAFTGSYIRGTVAQGFTRTDLVNADAAAGSAFGLSIVLPSGTYNVASSLTVNAPVVFQPGAVIKPASGVTVTLAGGISGPTGQLFDHSAGGTVLPLATSWWHPAWWGPVNTADDTPAWNAMVTSKEAHRTLTGKGVRVMMPQGVTRLWNFSTSYMHIECGGTTGSFIKPVTASAGSGGLMFSGGAHTTISGGEWHTDSLPNVALMTMTGARSWVWGAYVRPVGAGTLGIDFKRPGSTGSISPRIFNTIVRGDDGVTNGDGIHIGSSDAELTNTWVGVCQVGITTTLGATMLSNIHVWGCAGNGIVLNDSCQLENVYSETNTGWGIEAIAVDDTAFTNVRLWKNGAGGMRFSTINPAGGSFFCQQNTFNNVVLDDNTGVGLDIQGACTEFTGDVMVASSSVKGGGAALGTYGVQIASGCTKINLRIKGLKGNVLTAKVNNLSANVMVDIGSWRGVMSTPLVLNNTNAYSTLLTMPVGAGESWLIKGWAVVDASQAADIKVRLGVGSLTGATGWIGGGPGPANSNTSTTAFSFAPINAADISTGNGVTIGGAGVGSYQYVPFQAYIATGTVAGNVVLQGGTQNVDATDATFRVAVMEAQRLT